MSRADLVLLVEGFESAFKSCFNFGASNVFILPKSKSISSRAADASASVDTFVLYYILSGIQARGVEVILKYRSLPGKNKFMATLKRCYSLHMGTLN